MDIDYLNMIKEKALDEHIPILMDETLDVIKNILIDIKPRKILEIGTAVGYSASKFIQFSPDSKVDTIELDIERANQAIENIEKIGISNKINVIIGNAVEILPELNGKYDMIFIDANKGKYPFFLTEAIRLCSDNGVIIADNILYKGYVMSDYNKHKQRTAVNNLRKYIQMTKENDFLDTEILNVGDGLAISKKIK